MTNIHSFKHTSKVQVREASELGFKPGQWPESFRFGINNVLFERVSVETDNDGDVICVNYVWGSTKFVVLND